MDKKFGSEWVTDKGKIYRFDDVHCLLSFKKNDNSKGTAYITDYTGNKELNKAVDLFYVKSEDLKTPMGGKMAAFVNKGVAEEFVKGNNGQLLLWQQVEKGFFK
jgi:copper chaperone NosL